VRRIEPPDASADGIITGMRPRRPQPLTRFLRPFTTHLFNPVTRRFVQWLPWVSECLRIRPVRVAR